MKDKRSKTSALNGMKGGRPKELSEFDGCLPDEAWKPVKRFEAYFVSNMGRIISIKTGKPFLKRLSNDKDGYQITTLYKNEKHHPFSIHKLVLTAFVSPKPKGKECSHINHIKDDNRVENLEWISHKENVQGNIDRGIGCVGKRGAENHASHLTKETVISIRKYHDKHKDTHQKVADYFGLNRRLITKIINRERWRHV